MLIVEGWTVLRSVRAGEAVEMDAAVGAGVGVAASAYAEAVGCAFSHASLRL